MDTNELFFGFIDGAGTARKFAVVKVGHDDGSLRQIVVRQLDSTWLGHHTLHYVPKPSGQSTVYQFSLDHAEIFAEEDRPSGDKEILEQPVPDVNTLQGLWDLQAIPVWPAAPDIYPYMSTAEVETNREGIADFGPIAGRQPVGGMLNTYLVAAGNEVALAAHKRQVQDRGLLCWRVFKDVSPWVLGYVMGGGPERARSQPWAVSE